MQPQLAQVKTLINEARALQTSELEFSHLLSYVPEVCAESVVITDANGNIQWVNPAFSEITSLDPELTIQFLNHTTPGLTIEQVTGTPIAFQKNMFNLNLRGLPNLGGFWPKSLSEILHVLKTCQVWLFTY